MSRNIDRLRNGQHASVGCSIDDRDCGIVMASEYENVDQLLSRFDSFGGADFHFVNGRIHF